MGLNYLQCRVSAVRSGNSGPLSIVSPRQFLCLTTQSSAGTGAAELHELWIFLRESEFHNLLGPRSSPSHHWFSVLLYYKLSLGAKLILEADDQYLLKISKDRDILGHLSPTGRKLKRDLSSWPLATVLPVHAEEDEGLPVSTWHADTRHSFCLYHTSAWYGVLCLPFIHTKPFWLFGSGVFCLFCIQSLWDFPVLGPQLHPEFSHGHLLLRVDLYMV